MPVLFVIFFRNWIRQCLIRFRHVLSKVLVISRIWALKSEWLNLSIILWRLPCQDGTIETAENKLSWFQTASLQSTLPVSQMDQMASRPSASDWYTPPRTPPTSTTTPKSHYLQNTTSPPSHTTTTTKLQKWFEFPEKWVFLISLEKELWEIWDRGCE